jgi:uncharacterized protein (TIGR03435 family)
MSLLDDHDLVARYVREQSEAAFSELVTRHVGLVYSVAYRAVGDGHAAEEITQAVFIILAQKAGRISRKSVLPGWLHQTTRLTAANYQRTEIRRQRREHEAFMQSTLNESNPVVWSQIGPVLDEALDRLGERDRNAIVLRFFENKSLREVGAAIGSGEDAAKVRVSRALEKLRKIFSRRGITYSAAAIAGAVAAHSVHAAPAGLAVQISALAAAKGAAASGSTLTLVKGALKIMAWTKAKTAATVGITLLLAMGTASVIIPPLRQAYLERQVIWTIDSKVLQKEPPIVMIRPAQPIPGVYAGGGGYIGGAKGTSGKMIGLKQPILTMLLLAYQYPSYNNGIHPDRTILKTTLSEAQYDFIAATPILQREGLQRALKEKFGLIARWETQETSALLLTMPRPNAHGLRRSNFAYGASQVGASKLTAQGGPLSLLANFIEDSVAGLPVIDATGSTNAYDFELTWGQSSPDWRIPQRPELDQLLLDQLGLELVATNLPVEMLVVESIKPAK